MTRKSALLAALFSVAALSLHSVAGAEGSYVHRNNFDFKVGVTQVWATERGVEHFSVVAPKTLALGKVEYKLNPTWALHSSLSRTVSLSDAPRRETWEVRLGMFWSFSP